jgi:hypothetical protein
VNQVFSSGTDLYLAVFVEGCLTEVGYAGKNTRDLFPTGFENETPFSQFSRGETNTPSGTAIPETLHPMVNIRW